MDKEAAAHITMEFPAAERKEETTAIQIKEEVIKLSDTNHGEELQQDQNGIELK